MHRPRIPGDLGDPDSPITGTFAVDADFVTELKAGRMYVNVHNGTFPAGAARGQIVEATLLRHELEGSQEVPAVTTEERGRCIEALTFGGTYLEVWCTHSLDAGFATNAHIHDAPAGSNGAAVIDLAIPDANNAIYGLFLMSASTRADLAADSLYINVHTSEHAAGELRGQLP